MGIRNLLGYLRKYKPKFYQHEADYTLKEGKAYGLDLSVLLHDIFSFYLRTRVLDLVLGNDNEKAAAEQFVAECAAELVGGILAHGVSLAVVVEPVRLPQGDQKSAEQKRRTDARQLALENARQAREDHDEKLALRHAKRAAARTESMQERCVAELSKLRPGVVIIHCSGEADTMLAELERADGGTIASITKDSDHLMYGGNMVTVKNWRNLALEYTKLCASLLSNRQRSFVAAACCSDYSKGIRGVGPFTAFKFAAQFGAGDGDIIAAAKHKFGEERVPSKFEQVYRAFFEPSCEVDRSVREELKALDKCAARNQTTVNDLASKRAAFETATRPWYDQLVSRPFAQKVLRAEERARNARETAEFDTVHGATYAPWHDRDLKAKLRGAARALLFLACDPSGDDGSAAKLRKSRLGFSVAVRVVSPVKAVVSFWRFGEEENEQFLRPLRPPPNTLFREARPRINCGYLLVPVVEKRGHAVPFEGRGDFLAWSWTVYKPRSEKSRVIVREAFRSAGPGIPLKWRRDRSQSVGLEKPLPAAGRGVRGIRSDTSPSEESGDRSADQSESESADDCVFDLLPTVSSVLLPYDSRGRPKTVTAAMRKEAFPERELKRRVSGVDVDGGDEDDDDDDVSASLQAKRSRTEPKAEEAGSKRSPPSTGAGSSSKRARKETAEAAARGTGVQSQAAAAAPAARPPRPKVKPKSKSKADKSKPKKLKPKEFHEQWVALRQSEGVETGSDVQAMKEFVGSSLIGKPDSWKKSALKEFNLPIGTVDKLGFKGPAGRDELLRRVALQEGHRAVDVSNFKALVRKHWLVPKKVVLARLYMKDCVKEDEGKVRAPLEEDEGKVRAPDVQRNKITNPMSLKMNDAVWDEFFELEHEQLQAPLPDVLERYGTNGEALDEVRRYIVGRYAALRETDVVALTEAVKDLSPFERYVLKHDTKNFSCSDCDVAPIVLSLRGKLDTSVGGWRDYRINEKHVIVDNGDENKRITAENLARFYFTAFHEGYVKAARAFNLFAEVARKWLEEQRRGTEVQLSVIHSEVLRVFHERAAAEDMWPEQLDKERRQLPLHKRPAHGQRDDDAADDEHAAGADVDTLTITGSTPDCDKIIAAWLRNIQPFGFTRFCPRSGSGSAYAGARQADANMRSCVTNYRRGFHHRLGLPGVERHDKFESGPWCVDVPRGDVLGPRGRQLCTALRKRPGDADPVFLHDVKLMRAASGALTVRVLDSGRNRAPEGAQHEQLKPGHMAAADPGVRDFIVIVTGDGRVVKLHDPEVARTLRKLTAHADRLRELRRGTADLKRADVYRKEELRVNAKLRRVRKNFHRTVVNYLLGNFRRILLPKFGVRNMVRREGRAFGKSTTRSMLNWGHCEFREMLLRDAKLCPGVEVIVCDEPWTSKTCAWCGEVRHDLGGSKTFWCRKCRRTRDRDLNGAVNILVRYVTLWWRGYRPGEVEAAARAQAMKNTNDLHMEGEDPTQRGVAGGASFKI